MENLEYLDSLLEREIGYRPLAGNFVMANQGKYDVSAKTASVDGSVESYCRDFLGRGTFVEHSDIGLKMQELSGRAELGTYMNSVSDAMMPLMPFTNQQKYEGFSLWIQEMLLEAIGKEKPKVNPGEELVLDYIRDIDKTYGRFATLCEFGFPRNHSKHGDIVEALRKLEYKVEDDDLVIVYGSRKPRSDIDLFVLSDMNQGYSIDFMGWLDIFQMDRGRIDDYIKVLDYSVTDVLFSGEVIHGSRNYHEKLKEQVLIQPITQEAIDYHENIVKERQEDLINNPSSERNNRLRMENMLNCLTNAGELRQGNKHLTMKELKKHYHKYELLLE